LEQLAIFRTINLNYSYIHVSRATELLVGLTFGTRRPKKTAPKIGAEVTQNLEERMESPHLNALLDNYHIYIFTFTFCIDIYMSLPDLFPYDLGISLIASREPHRTVTSYRSQ
jgi:hypothetical protein